MVRASVIKLLKPLARSLPPAAWRLYIRYAPWPHGKLWVLERIVEPFYNSHPSAFVARTVLGSRISGGTDDFIPRVLFYYGVWEPTMTAWIRKRLATGDTFIDVGANIGYYSLLASKLVGRTGRVLAIEPSPEIFALLKNHLEMNDAHNVRAVRMAVSDHRETLRLYRGPAWNRGLATTHLKIDDLSEWQASQMRRALGSPSDFSFESEVEAVPFGDITQDDELKTARIIKIDCEGAEWAIAVGMIPHLASARPDLEIVVEIIPEYLLAYHKTPEDLLDLFSDAGFHAYRLDTEFKHQRYISSRLQTTFPRIRTPIDEETNVIFSRTDAEELTLLERVDTARPSRHHAR
jgi:FkbM family methyltransferase